MSRSLPVDEMDEDMKSIEARSEEDKSYEVPPSSPSDTDKRASASKRHNITWTGTRNTVAVAQVNKSFIHSIPRLVKPKFSRPDIKKWLKPTTSQACTGIQGKKRDRSPSPVQRRPNKSQCCGPTSVDGSSIHAHQYLPLPALP